MISASNTTPILSLHKIGKLSLLREIFGKIYIPAAVYNEIAVGKDKVGYNLLEAVDYIQMKQIQNFLAADLLRSQLDIGESEAIVLARELNANILIMDEKKGRRIAQANGQKIIGTVGILQVAKNRGLIRDLKAILDELIIAGVWIDRKLYQDVLDDESK